MLYRTFRKVEKYSLNIENVSYFCTKYNNHYTLIIFLLHNYNQAKVSEFWHVSNCLAVGSTQFFKQLLLSKMPIWNDLRICLSKPKQKVARETRKPEAYFDTSLQS